MRPQRAFQCIETPQTASSYAQLRDHTRVLLGTAAGAELLARGGRQLFQKESRVLSASVKIVTCEQISNGIVET